MTRAAVLGAGSWGTALGTVLAANHDQVTMWDIDHEVLKAIDATHENPRYLPGVTLPVNLGADADLGRALDGAQVVLVAVPSQSVRLAAVSALDALAPAALVCCAAKGAELDTLMLMSDVLEDVFPAERHGQLAYVSGPSFAVEVVARMPTAVTVASRSVDTAARVQAALATSWFRTYTSTDIVGVEIGGCVKNVIAIGAGAAAGLGFGANAGAALISRGLAEIIRLAVAMGGEELTVCGLAGLGDLVLTCSSTLSRNYRVGLAVGAGRSLSDVQAELGQVAEGVVNARTVLALAERHGVELPICETVHEMLFHQLPPEQAVTRLMTRALRPERDA